MSRSHDLTPDDAPRVSGPVRARVRAPRSRPSAPSSTRAGPRRLPVRGRAQVRLAGGGPRRQRVRRPGRARRRPCRSAPAARTWSRRPATQLLAFGNEDSHGVTNPLMSQLARRLIDVSPASLTRVDLALNGTEAVESAVRFMRRATGDRSSWASTAATTASRRRRPGWAPSTTRSARASAGLGGGFVHAPYPHPYRTPFAPPRPGGSGDSTIDFIRDQMLFHAVDPTEVAGVVIEPVLGSGGVVVPPAGFWTGAGRALPRVRLAAVPGRGQDRVRADRATLRGGAVGPAARPDVPGQGDGRRGDADRGGARVGRGAQHLRRRVDGQHLGLAARGLRGGHEISRRVRAGRSARERPGAPRGRPSRCSGG